MEGWVRARMNWEGRSGRMRSCKDERVGRSVRRNWEGKACWRMMWKEQKMEGWAFILCNFFAMFCSVTGGLHASKFLPLHYNLNPLSRLSYRYPDIRQQSPICEAGCLHLPQWRVRYGSRHRWIQRRSLVFIWKPKKKTHLNKIKNATRFFYRPQSL